MHDLSEIERHERLYEALRLVHRAIVRTQTRDTLFRAVCEALVSHGGFGLAWIGWVDPISHRLVPVAHVGDESGYLDSIQITVDDGERGRGPSGIAIREGRAYVSNDLLAEPGISPWRAELERRGFRASAAIPVRTEGAVCGALNVYSDRVGFFRDREIELLTDAAADLSFGLENLARDEERRRAEDSVRRLGALVESTDDAIISQTLTGEITSVNRAAQTMFGFSSAEILGRSSEVMIPPELLDQWKDVRARIARGEHVANFETIRQRMDGTRFPVSITYSPIRSPDDAAQIVGVSKIIRDITDRRQAEAVADREMRFAASVLTALPGIFYLYDQQGRFLRWNHDFERVSGYAGSEIACMTPPDFFAGDDKALLRQKISEVFEHGQSSLEASFVAKDGTATPYFFTGRRTTFEGASCLIGVGVDISERKRAESAVRASDARYRTTLDAILEGCQLLGFDWRYLYLNPAAAIQNRRPNSELLGERMQSVWPSIEQTEVFALLARCMDERLAVQGEIPFTFPDGSSGWFDIRARPVPEGIFVLSIDISERKEAERALHDLNASLEGKVRDRTRELEAARERAESADRLKSAFLATMSHELRTPLNSILGFTGTVLLGMAGPLSAEQTKQLKMVQVSARHLLDLINDVLDISKIEAGQLEVRPSAFDLRASVERVVSSVKLLLDKKALSIVVTLPDAPATMHSDQRRVEQILLNLLNNAIKFTDAGRITLQVRIEGERVRMSVADTGIGMRPEDIDGLFQPFRQLDSGLQRQHEGTGLGLAICRRLATLLGGTIDVTSTFGAGSTFTVDLPMNGPMP